MLKNLSRILEDFYSSTDIVQFRLVLWSDDLVVLPPFTSKLVKSVVEVSPGLSVLRALYHSSARPRRVRLSLLSLEGDRMLYRVVGGREPAVPLHMRPGLFYGACISAFASNALELVASVQGSELVETSFGRVGYELREALVYKSPPPPPPWPFDLRLEFLSPTLISAKLAVPPWLAERASGVPSAYRLVPTPGLVGAACLKGLLELLGRVGRSDQSLHYYLMRLLDTTVVELDYNLKPVTVLYDRGEGGERLCRGFVGRAVYRPLKRRVGEALYVLLKTCEATGVGKSRAMGFGELRIAALKRNRG